MELKPYAAARFVNREDEVRLVDAIVQQLAAGEPVAARTIVFRGERGAGKTWLSLHLKQHIAAKGYSAEVLLLSLFPPPDTYAEHAAADEWFASAAHAEPEAIVVQIAGWLAAQLRTTTAAHATLAELSYWLTRDIGTALGGKLLVLIVDSAYEADWEILKLLEKYILAPLAALPNSLLVITGRGRPYLWNSPALRINAIDRQLTAFDLNLVRQQLERMGYDPDQAEEILKRGGGHPLNTYLLMVGYGQPNALNRAVQELLVVLPREDRAHMRMSLEALCLLDGFVEDDIAPMLAVRHHDATIETWSMQQVREERDCLVRTQMVQWQQGRFVIDEPVRIVISSYLRLEATEGLWEKLQTRAADMYLGRALRYPKYAQHFLQRANRHCQALLDAGIPSDCADRLTGAQPTAPVI